MHSKPTASEIAEGLQTIDDLLVWKDIPDQVAIRLVDQAIGTLRKQDPDLTTPEGFLEWVLTLALDLRLADRNMLVEATNQLRPLISVNWPGLSQSEVEDALEDVRRLVAAFRARIVASQLPLLEQSAERTIFSAMADHNRRFRLGITPSLTESDLAEQRYLANSTANFLRQRDGTIVNEFSQRAREIVTQGVKEGLPNRTIANRLEASFGATQSHKYYEIVANQFVSRAQAWGALRSYQKAGIQLAEIMAMMDERTCFVGETKIGMADGSRKRIDLIDLGELVCGIDGKPRKVIGKIKKECRKVLYRLTLGSGVSIIGTWQHPVLTSKGWIRLGELKEGDKIATPRLAFPRYMDRNDLPKLWEDVSSPQDLFGSGANEVLFNSMSCGTRQERNFGFGVNEGLFSLREEVSGKTDCNEKESQILFKSVSKSEAPCVVQLRDVRKKSFSQETKIIGNYVLLHSLLHEVKTRYGTGTGCKEKSFGSRVVIRTKGSNRTLEHRFFNNWVDSIGNRWGVLARETRSKRTRYEEGFGITQKGLSCGSIVGGTGCQKPFTCDERTLSIFPNPQGEYIDWSDVSGLEMLLTSMDVYDVQIEGLAGYIANGMIVHNSDICRFLDGKYISVNGSLGMLQGLEEVTDPEKIKEMNPWIHESSDKSYLYIVGPNGEEIRIADVVRSGVGSADDTGEYDNAKNMAELQVLGIGPPPYHANCRTTLVPVVP